MLVVQMTLVEIREAYPQVDTLTFDAKTIKNPKDASTVNLGQKQPSVLSRVRNMFGG